jgi:dTDP-4-dehydrorhamnose reductase
VRDAIARFAPDLVIHAAAATDVDGCERDPDLAFAINALGTRHVMNAAAAVAAEVVYVSTNYVFDGSKSAPYHEFDNPAPISIYGASKLAGELETRAATRRHYIARTAWLYAPEGRNFVTTMRRLLSSRDEVRVVDDQYGNPTLASDLAEALVGMVETGSFGTYHVVNTGVTSWHGWAVEIARLDASAATVAAIPATEYPRAATPPANGSLASMALPALGVTLPAWQDALRRCLTQ